MKSTATSPDEYFEALPEARKVAMSQLRKTLLNHLPKGFEEMMSYGMVGYCVPLKTYPAGYHCAPNQALPFISIASQKNFVALYHMGLYADAALMDWFLSEYALHSKSKPDMGKSCIRFKKPEMIPFDLIGKLAGKMTPKQWITLYESVFKR
ncbi:MAG: DUF1801 domain-containing protein [Bacteroidetes bacterium]|nr:DUF1801 domain-containing protein [Bacteroidota bacterium]MBS1628743.1 DUF1801 domain-containing protein [Bacteroidota bacterium]